MEFRKLPNFARWSATALLLALAACSHFATTRKSVPPHTDARGQLSIGYSLLYQEASGIPKLKWVLMFKEKSSEMAQLTQDLLGYYEHLSDSLQKLSRQNPVLRIDVQTMSAIESEEREAIGADQAKDMAPLAGKAGTAFEREALLLFYNALDEQRHLVGVMRKKEDEPALQRFLDSTKAQLDEHYAKVGALLNRRYFVH
jgi:uncharacterized membrane-anchored protein YhcB (DUF1043 family)